MIELKIEDNPVLTTIRKRLDEIIGENVKQIILFGSRARGDAVKDSDYDVLLLVNKRSRQVEKQADDIAYEMLERFGAVVTIFVEEKDTFQRETSEPLFCNIRREGAVL